MKDFVVFSAITIFAELFLILVTEMAKDKFPTKAIRSISRILLLLWVMFSVNVAALCGYISINLFISGNFVGGLKLIVTFIACIAGIYVLFLHRRILKWKNKR